MSAATALELAENELDARWEAKMAAERNVVEVWHAVWHAEQALKARIADRQEAHEALERAHAAYMVEYDKGRNQDHGDVGAIMAQIEGGGA